MIIVMFSIVLVVLAVSTILIAVPIKHLSDEIDELKEKLEFHRIKLKNLDFYDLSGHEKRLDQLEHVLDCMRYYNVKKMVNNEQNI